MRKLLVLSFSFSVALLSCSKTAVVPEASMVSDRVSTVVSAKDSASKGTTWMVEGGDFVWTECADTKAVKSSCGDTYRGGLTTQSTGLYATLLTIEIRRCDGKAFTKQKGWQAIVKKDNLCGDVIGKADISPNYQYVTVTFNILHSDTTKYFPTIVTPAGKRYYSNPLTVIASKN